MRYHHLVGASVHLKAIEMRTSWFRNRKNEIHLADVWGRLQTGPERRKAWCCGTWSLGQGSYVY